MAEQTCARCGDAYAEHGPAGTAAQCSMYEAKASDHVVAAERGDGVRR